MTEVIQCTCKSEFQDELYGKNMRLMNLGNSEYHCTVCGKAIRSSEAKRKTN